MTFLVTVNVLVNKTDESSASALISEILGTAMYENLDGVESKVLDFEVSEVSRTITELDDSISNEIYAEGDAFSDWVVYSPSEAAQSEDSAGFWSNTYGWTTYDRATRLPPVFRLPQSTANDAVWMLAKNAQDMLRSA